MIRNRADRGVAKRRMQPSHRVSRYRTLGGRVMFGNLQYSSLESPQQRSNILGCVLHMSDGYVDGFMLVPLSWGGHMRAPRVHQRVAVLATFGGVS